MSSITTADAALKALYTLNSLIYLKYNEDFKKARILYTIDRLKGNQPCSDSEYCFGHGTCSVQNGLKQCACSGGYGGNNCFVDPDLYEDYGALFTKALSLVGSTVGQKDERLLNALSFLAVELAPGKVEELTDTVSKELEEGLIKTQ